MRFKSIAFLIMVLVVFSLNIGKAKAAIVNILPGVTYYNFSPGMNSSLSSFTDANDPVSLGISGSLDFTCPSNGCLRSRATVGIIGYLPPNSMMTLSYTSPTLGQPSVNGIGTYSSYDYLYNGDQYNGVYRTGNGNILNDSHFVNGNVSSNSLVITSAQLGTNGSPLAHGSIQNISKSNAYFEAFFSANLTDLSAGSGFTANYTVSAVPLPGALPLFGLGIAGLMGYRRFKG